MNADPTLLIELSVAYWRSQALFAALDLGLFGHVAAGARSPEAVAAAAKADPRAVDLLMHACAAIGLLNKVGDGGFENAPVSDAFLVEGKPTYWGGVLGFARAAYGAWGGLASTVRSGQPALAPAAYLGGSGGGGGPEAAAATRRYTMGLYENVTRGLGRGVVARLDLTGRKHLLDVGGGAGAYAVLLCQKFPDLRVTLLELPAIAAVARENVAREGLSSRVTVVDGDFHEMLPPAAPPYDAALLAGVLHRERGDAVIAILKRVHAAVGPGARVFVNDVLREGDGTGPELATLFGLHMLLTAPGGGAHRIDDQRAWLEAAGFHGAAVTRLPPPSPYVLVTAER